MNNSYRVKLYLLNGSSWNDKGTGYVSLNFSPIDDEQKNTLNVKAENEDKLLLQHIVKLDIIYQKQQETLILWTEKEDIALSFQEKEGRDVIWGKICQIQGKDPNSIPEDDEDEEEEEDTDVSMEGDLTQDLQETSNLPKVTNSSITDPISPSEPPASRITMKDTDKVTTNAQQPLQAENIDPPVKDSPTIGGAKRKDTPRKGASDFHKKFVRTDVHSFAITALQDQQAEQEDSGLKDLTAENKNDSVSLSHVSSVSSEHHSILTSTTHHHSSSTSPFNFSYEDDFEDVDLDKYSSPLTEDNLVGVGLAGLATAGYNTTNSSDTGGFGNFFTMENSLSTNTSGGGTMSSSYYSSGTGGLANNYFNTSGVSGNMSFEANNHADSNHQFQLTGISPQFSTTLTTSSILDASSDSTGELILPECEISRLPEIAAIVADHVGVGGIVTLSQANKREKLSNAIEVQDYITSLLEVFRMCEDLEDINGLHHIFAILKNLFLLNRNAVLELLLADDTIVDVIGCLEYDPSLPPRVLKSDDLKNEVLPKGITPKNENSDKSNDKKDLVVKSNEKTVDDPNSIKDVQDGKLSDGSDSKASEKDSGDKIVYMETDEDDETKVKIKQESSPVTDTQTQIAGKESTKPYTLSLIGCHKQNHREYILKEAKFKEAIPITNKELLSKIHQTYRVQYIQDVIFPQPSIFEENVLSSLTSFLFFNKLEIVSFIQDDEQLLLDGFNQLSSETTTLEPKRNLILFFKEFCLFSQTLQSHNKEKFFKAIMQKGILTVLESLLPCDDDITRNAIIDILWFLVEFNPSQIRDFIIKECHTSQEEDTYFLNVLIEQMICDPDPELGNAMQISLILKTIADPDNMSANKGERAEFLSVFYKYNFHVLVAPLLAKTSEAKLSKDDYKTAHLLSVIIEILSFYNAHHTFHSKNYFTNKDLFRRTLVLMQSKHHFLVLSALRLLRNAINLKDEYLNRHITKNSLFKPVVEAFVRNGKRYNLLNSAILELFDFIYMEDIKILNINFIENYYENEGKKYGLDKVDYVDTFKKLKTRYDQHMQVSGVNSSIKSPASSIHNGSTIQGFLHISHQNSFQQSYEVYPNGDGDLKPHLLSPDTNSNTDNTPVNSSTASLSPDTNLTTSPPQSETVSRPTSSPSPATSKLIKSTVVKIASQNPNKSWQHDSPFSSAGVTSSFIQPLSADTGINDENEVDQEDHINPESLKKLDEELERRQEDAWFESEDDIDEENNTDPIEPQKISIKSEERTEYGPLMSEADIKVGEQDKKETLSIHESTISEKALFKEASDICDDPTLPSLKTTRANSLIPKHNLANQEENNINLLPKTTSPLFKQSFVESHDTSEVMNAEIGATFQETSNDQGFDTNSNTTNNNISSKRSAQNDTITKQPLLKHHKHISFTLSSSAQPNNNNNHNMPSLSTKDVSNETSPSKSDTTKAKSTENFTNVELPKPVSPSMLSTGKISPLSSLVDYEEDSEDEEESLQ